MHVIEYLKFTVYYNDICFDDLNYLQGNSGQ